MNNKKLETLGAMRDFYAKNSILPTYSEIIKFSPLKSKSEVHRIVHELIDDGYFIFSKSKRLVTQQKFFDDAYVLGVTF